jgi:hypothetical protein
MCLAIPSNWDYTRKRITALHLSLRSGKKEPRSLEATGAKGTDALELDGAVRLRRSHYTAGLRLVMTVGRLGRCLGCETLYVISYPKSDAFVCERSRWGGGEWSFSGRLWI